MQPRVVLASSGLGSRGGGIGTVTAMIRRALAPVGQVRIWHHPHAWPRRGRQLAFVLQAAVGAFFRPSLVLYEHVDLAQVHARFPWLRKVPYAVFIHGTEVWRPLSEARRRALQGARVLLANSHTTVERARAMHPWLPPVRVVWLGVEAPRVRADVLRSAPVALLVGRMSAAERYKGHDVVLDAWPRIREQVPEAKLVIVGDGNDRSRLEARVSSERLEGVRFLGYVSDAERDRLYAESRAFLFVSTQEGFGLAGVEALAAGVPVIGVRGTVLQEIFPPGNGVVFAETASADEVARALVPLLQNAARAAELGNAGRARVEQNFLRPHFEERLRAALADVLGLVAVPLGAQPTT